MFFFFKQKTAYEMLRSLVGSEMCIRDRPGKVAIGGFGLDAQGHATTWEGLPIKDGFRAALLSLIHI